MKVELCKISNGKLCAIFVNKREALKLIQSLTNQLVNESSNFGRWEPSCSGDATEMTIFVDGDLR